MKESDFIVSIHFTPAGREWLQLGDGPANEYPEPADLFAMQSIQVGDFLRMQGIAGLWAVQYRTWHLMEDQTQLKLTLDGPIEEDA